MFVSEVYMDYEQD